MRTKCSRFILFLVLLCITGCSNVSRKEPETVARICSDFFKEAEKDGRMEDLDVFTSIVHRFGDSGYAAVDGRNLINMTNPEQVVRFCEQVDAKEEGSVSIMKVNDREGVLDGVTEYDMDTKDGEVEITFSYFKYENQEMKKTFTAGYTADSWEYTEDGHLMFSGNYYSEELYALTLSDAKEHMMFRVLPLDEKCRELNWKYIFSIGYGRNNMFLTDWDESDYGELEFYDLYDILYRRIHHQYVPYGAGNYLGDGTIYRIPEEEFESVIMTYFHIDSNTLKSRTVFHPEDETYGYRPRGYYEAEYPEYPYPEVIGYVENGDGTMTLTVHAVFPYKGISKVYAHEVVIRPLESGGVQYVSNRVIPSESNYEVTWHKPRLTDGL